MRIPRWLLCALLLLGAAGFARASYTPPSTDELLVGAKTVAYGKIEGLTEKHFVLRVERWIRAGPEREEKDARLTVRRFVDWSCGERGRPYEVGQRLLVFVDRRDGELVTRGGGCEGEWYFDDDEEAEASVSAVAAYAGRFVPVGAKGWVPAWRELLIDGDPIVRRFAARAITDTSSFNPARPKSMQRSSRTVLRPQQGQHSGGTRVVGLGVRPEQKTLRTTVCLHRQHLRPVDLVPGGHPQERRLLRDTWMPVGLEDLAVAGVGDEPLLHSGTAIRAIGIERHRDSSEGSG